jgi:protein Tex
VHPESYPIVEGLAQKLGVRVEQMIQNAELLNKVEKGSYTLNDILEELKKPGRDPRDKFVAPTFKDDIREIADLKPGMKLEGVVTNVTRFGAFVDIGVHNDGLVHISELSNRYVQDPNEVVKVGQIVNVQVVGADPKTKRIALSMKTQAPPPKPKASLVDLADRWKVR